MALVPRDRGFALRRADPAARAAAAALRPGNRPGRGFDFEEDVDGKDHSKYLWGNAAYALGPAHHERFRALRLVRGHSRREGGGLVEGLPAHTFKTDDGDIALKCPTEIAITDRREKELSDLGFIRSCHCKGTDYAAFFGGQTDQQAEAVQHRRGQCQRRCRRKLPYILAASRFAHYLKAMMRDKIGSFMTRDNVRRFLNRWITDYVLLDDNAPQEVKAQYPLREARIDVIEDSGQAGLLPCGRLPPSALPARRADGLVAAGR